MREPITIEHITHYTDKNIWVLDIFTIRHAAGHGGEIQISEKEAKVFIEEFELEATDEVNGVIEYYDEV